MLDVRNFTGDKLRWSLQVLHDQELTPLAKVVATQIMHDLNVERRGAWRSQDALARILGVNVSSIRRAVATLVRRGHLVKNVPRGRGQTNHYEALLHDLEACGMRPQASGLASENRAGASGFNSAPPSENRSPVRGKVGAGAPQTLEEPLNHPLSPEVGSELSLGLPSRLQAVPAEFRQAIVFDLRWGEAWARSWLDPCGFDPETQLIHPRTAFARGKILEAIAPALRSFGLSLGDPHGQSTIGGAAT